jgi:hypothetical protein
MFHQYLKFLKLLEVGPAVVLYHFICAMLCMQIDQYTIINKIVSYCKPY